MELYKGVKRRRLSTTRPCLGEFEKHEFSVSCARKREEELKIEGNVIHTGLVTKDELVDFYNLADLFVFPSLYEGFGIPPLEAMACGTPVICADNSSLPEVVGDVAMKFNAKDIKQMAELIEKQMYEKEKQKTDLLIKHVKKFNWNDSVKKTKQKILR